MHLLYAIASYVIFLLGLPVLLTHPKLRDGVRVRLGLYRDLPRCQGNPRIWLHGASAGDLLALQPMMRELKARLPGCCIVVTTITNSGLAMARKKLSDVADVVVYAPYDLPGPTRRAVAALQPDLLVLEYTEISAQPHPRRPEGGRQDRAHQRPVRPGQGLPLPGLLPRHRQPAAPHRLLPDAVGRGGGAGPGAGRGAGPGLGHRQHQVRRPVARRRGRQGGGAARGDGLEPGRPVFMAGSTHEGEEEILLTVYARLAERHPGLQMVVAPRYIERSGKIMSLAAEAGLSVRLRSGGTAAGHAQVTILDTIGELAVAYRLATLVFVGGSFVTRGGQNVLEPAAQGCPVLFGPHMENFKDSVQVLQGRGGIQVATPDKLFKVADELLLRPDQVKELGILARRSVSAIRGASARNVDHLLSILPRGKAAA